MTWLFRHISETRYWLRVFALYAMAEACIQLLFYFLLNNFGPQPISNIESHVLMWFFQCLLIWPIWWVAWSVSKRSIALQVVVNTIFYLIYSYLWFGPVQDLIGFLYESLRPILHPGGGDLGPSLDKGDQYPYLNYQLLKHAFRLSWFFLAAYFLNFRHEEKKRLDLAIANKDLQLRLLKWHLNPSFYFKTIEHLQEVAAKNPTHTTESILQLAKVMEYVIYEAKEKLIDVRKEIQFISNYVRLINEQPSSNATFQFNVTGEHSKLKIAPLLLAGFIDKISGEERGTKRRSYDLQLSFASNEMRLIIQGDQLVSPLSNGDALALRLKDIYHDRYFINPTTSANKFEIVFKLDDER